MATSDPLKILLAHDKWATQQLLNACVSLSSDKFHQRFEMGSGSLHDTLTHMASAMQTWGDLLVGRAFRPRFEGTVQTVPELETLLDRVHDEFIEASKAHPLDRTVTRERDGKSYTFTRGAVITHVATHGMHHRAQCLNMLRQVGAQQPLSSVTQWTLHGDPLR